MKHAKALQSHMYDGKRRNVGDVYPIRRTDWQLMQKLGRIELVANPDEVPVSFSKPKPQSYIDVTRLDSKDTSYRTTAMDAEPEPVRTKRPYRRKVIQKADEE